MTYSALDVLRLLSKVKFCQNGCWEWQGALSRDGYGQVGKTVEGRFRCFAAHRLTYEMWKGPVGNLNVCHSCDNRRCIAPNHLWLGTQKQNMQDAARKGRMRNTGGQTIWYRPVGNGLKEAEVNAILWLLGIGWNCRKVARYMKATRANVSLIKNGKRWKHLARPPALRSG